MQLFTTKQNGFHQKFSQSKMIKIKLQILCVKAVKDSLQIISVLL